MNKRHELQKNELAYWLEDKTEEVRPYLPAIGIGTLLAVVVVAGIWWYSSRQAQASASSWNQYFAALGERNQEEALQKVIEVEKTTEPANWARQTLADMKLARGAAAVFTDREESKKQLDAAAALYSEILEYTNDPLLQSRAGFGLARTQESLFKPEEAKKLYEEVAKTNPDTAIGKASEEAAARLSNKEDLQMLNWLAEQKPKRPAPVPSGRPGGVPGLPGASDLPDRPDIGLPDFGSPATPGGEKSSSGLSFPAPGDAPAEDAPASEAPSTDAPAPDAPASEKADADAPPAENPPPPADNPPSEEPADNAAPAPPEGDAPPADEGSK